MNPNLGSGPIPLREGEDNLWMSQLGMALSCWHQPLFLTVSTPAQGFGLACYASWGFHYLRMLSGGRPVVSTASQRIILHPLQVSFFLRRDKACLCIPGSLCVSTFLPIFISIAFISGGAWTSLHRSQSRLRRGRWRMSRCWCLFKKMLRASSVRSPSSRMNMWRHISLRGG
jgi:hypothetical protein